MSRNNTAASANRLFNSDDDVRIELVSEYKCNSKAELWEEESRIIKAVECVNKTYKNI